MANGSDDLLVRLKEFLILLTEKFLKGYQIVVIVIAALFFLIVGTLLLIFR